MLTCWIGGVLRAAMSSCWVVVVVIGIGPCVIWCMWAGTPRLPGTLTET